MKSHWQLLSVFLLLSSPASGADRYFASAGPSSTETYGFEGGWGVSLGFDQPIAESASLLLRADFTALPSTRGGYDIFPLGELAEGAGLGESGPDAATASLGHLMFGLRLKPTGRVRPYLDALIGVGHLNDPAQSKRLRNGTNTVLSFGTGVELPRTFLGSPFAEVRYDFYYVSGTSGPVIPVRVGFIVP